MKVLSVFLMCWFPVLLCAQSLTGRVIDELSQPLAFANVVLLNRADSSFVTGTMTKEDGTFEISTSNQEGVLKVSFVGYSTHYINCQNGDLGDIMMNPDLIWKNEVVVVGHRPQYKMITGGMTVDIQNSMLKDLGTADDVLSMLPRVQGEDGNFTVFAKGTPEIYINNKKIQNVTELKQLKSSDIKSVDIITTPGAKYNAEVGAIIRIKTVRPQSDGISVETYSQVRRNNKWNTYDDADVKYRNGRLEVSGNVGFENENHSENTTVTTNTYANNNHVNITQVAPNGFWSTMLNGKLSTSYYFNDDNSIGLSYGLSGSIYEGGNAQTWQTITRNDALEGTVDQQMDIGASESPMHEANLYYVGKAGKLGIDFNGSWVWKKTTRDQTSVEKSLQLVDQDIHSHNESRNRMLAGKLVLTYSVWKGELSVGSEIMRSNSHALYNNAEQIVSASDDKIKENNVAAFAEYQFRAGNWSFNGGLRYESVTSDYYSFGQYQTEQSRSYHNLFPNISIGWQKDKWSVQLSYGKRISRPSYSSLSSNVQYDNRYAYEGGNPLLRPTIKQHIDLYATYAWLSFTAGYNRNKDMILRFGDLYQSGTEITFWTSRNFDKYESYHATLTASPRFGFYRPTITLKYLRQNFDVQGYGVSEKLNTPLWQMDLRNWFVIDKTTRAMLFLRYATGYDNGFTHFQHAFNINVRAQKSFLEGSLTLAVFANDVFRTLRERWSGYYSLTTTSKDAYVYTQSIGISLTYRLNATQNRYKGTGAGNEEKGRL